MRIKVQMIFYSLYGQVYNMAQAVVEGAKQLPGAEVSLYHCGRVDSRRCVVEKHGAKAAKASFSKVPVATVHQLADAHTIIFGTPTRFAWPRGCAISSIRRDPCGPKGSLIGKIGSVFASTATQDGGQETTLTSFHTTLLHHGMVIVGVP